MILQLDPSVMVETPLGTGQALFLIDYGMHQNTCWVIALVKDGIIKHFDCNDVILSVNHTYGLNLIKNKLPRVNVVSKTETANKEGKAADKKLSEYS